MVKHKLVTILFCAFVTLSFGVKLEHQPQKNNSTRDSLRTSPSKSRIYYHQAFSHTESGGNDEIPQAVVQNKAESTFPSSIQAVNKSLEDAALKVSETRQLLGYEPETWNNRYTPPIPLDVLASETDEDEQDHDERVDDDDGDNDGEESNDDEQTHQNNNNQGDHSDQSDDDAPDGEVTEAYNDDNAQKVIDEIDGDIGGQEGGNRNNEDFAFAATEQRQTVVKPEQQTQKDEKPKRCKTVSLKNLFFFLLFLFFFLF